MVEDDGKASRRLRVVAAVLVGAAVLLILSAVGHSASAPPAVAPAPSPGPGSGCERLPYRAAVRQVGAAIVFPEVSYAIDRTGDRPRIDLSGSYRGDLPEERRIAVITRPDPASYDSSPGHRPGDGHYYYQRELRVDREARCWSAVSFGGVYSGSAGLAWQVYFALVPADFGVTSVSARNHVDEGVLASLEILASFTVQT
ncbi:hypothetical protein DQ384_10955 [Sphaerisporangium album]|uniref:Uncharacterized protein n=1 Tax=Sphaerisporangium album TaxID=509200 RepID=A0A367FLH0_9ACTN|nr:hypothetical protein DQ384_10955 [Sphaerisporangium album]